MKEYLKELEKQLEEINTLLTKSGKNMQRYKNLEDIRVWTSLSNGCPQFYCSKGEGEKRKYIKKNEIKFYSKYVQRDYEFAVNKRLIELRNNLSEIIRLGNQVGIDNIKSIYTNLPAAKRKIVVPIIEPDHAYIQSWKEEHPGYQNPFPEGGNVYTQKGEPVRSKSEKIIADLLDKYNIPYVYEPRLELNNMHTVYPDFATLNVRKKKTIYLEHLGLIDVDEYAAKNLQKIAEYEKAGYELGDTLIITTETGLNPLDSRLVESKILKHCM